MKFEAIDPPRAFTVKGVTMEHAANIELADDELVTFKTPSGAEFDVTAKDWGFYATPSTNGRLKDFGFRTALTRSNITGRRYILLVEQEKFAEFEAYCEEQSVIVEAWLEEDE